MSPGTKNSILALLVATGMFLSFYYLERAFRGGDTRRAVQAVQQTRSAPDGPTILEEIEAQYGKDAKFSWFAEIKDSFRGVIEVTCVLPDQTQRRWDVDLVRAQVSPAKD